VNYILDTNVISELVTAQPNPKVVRWVEEVDPDTIFLSVIAIGELKKGIEKLSESRRKKLLDTWLCEDLLVRFQDHILSIDTETMLIWGAMNARLEAAGRPISAIDALLAATANQHHCTLVTRNTAHFGNTGIELKNPWEDER
jgi:toxin FitB